MVPRALSEGIDLGLDDAGTPDDQPEPAVTIEGNALLIREAIVNVIDNAIRYAGRSTEITVRVRESREGPQSHPTAVVEVDDTGPGLPPHLHAQVFDRFFRGTTEGRGCGLGLAIVKEIVERHQGQAWVESLRPRGLRVTLRLPIIRDFT
jgi:two-component system sensor histidine kinase TctE